MEYLYAMAHFGIADHEFLRPVIFWAEGQLILGATTLQIFNLMVSPSEEGLVT